jgi:hypothetical protein
MQWARGIVSTQAFCTNICTAATYRLVSRLAISGALCTTRSGGIEAFRDAAYYQKFFDEHNLEK